MENDGWSFFSATNSSRSYHFIAQSDSCFDYNEEEEDGGDDLQEYFPCPFCSEDYDLLSLCYHIDDEHPIEAKLGLEVCPVCATRVGMNMVRHIMMQHGDILKTQNRFKVYQENSPPSLSFTTKDFYDEDMETLTGGSSSITSTSKIATDPLLSFVRNESIMDQSNRAQLDSSTEVNVEDKSSDHALLERDVGSSLSNTDQIEKTKRCEFMQGILLSTIFNDGL